MKIDYRHPLYWRYQGMVQRCTNPKDPSWARYGGRDIRVCDEWLDDPTAFFTWALANGYDRSLKLDRRDNNGNYTPENCRWVTTPVSNQNREMTTRRYDALMAVLPQAIQKLRTVLSVPVMRVADGKKFSSITEASKETGLPASTIRSWVRGIGSKKRCGQWVLAPN